MGRTHIVAFLLAQGAQPGPRNVDNTNLHLSINYKGHCRYAVHKTPCNCSMVAPDLAKAVTMKSVVFRDHVRALPPRDGPWPPVECLADGHLLLQGKKPVDLGHTDEVRGTLRRAAFARQMGIHHVRAQGSHTVAAACQARQLTTMTSAALPTLPADGDRDDFAALEAGERAVDRPGAPGAADAQDRCWRSHQQEGVSGRAAHAALRLRTRSLGDHGRRGSAGGGSFEEAASSSVGCACCQTYVR